MKRKLVTCITLAACVLALCLGLAGCGPDYKANFAGTWRVVAMVDSTGADLTPTIEQLAGANKYLTLTLADEDDIATFDLAGQTTLSGTWKPAGEAQCLITFEGYDEIPAVLDEDGLLTFEENGQTMTCEREDAQAAEGDTADADATGEGQAAEQPAE